MKSKKVLAKILYWALTEIRTEAKEIKNIKMFVMANTLCNLPLKLAKAETAIDYDAILAELESDCKDNAGMQHFIRQVKEMRIE